MALSGVLPGARKARPEPDLVSLMKVSARFLAISAISLICLFAFFIGLGSYPLLDPGDGYFAEASREMLRRGEMIVPHLNGQIYFSKPIMIYWLIMSSYQAFGINEFAARLPSALLATVTVFLTFLMGQKLKGIRAGFLAAAVLASSPLFCTFGRMCLVDMTFTAFLAGALAATLFALGSNARTQWIWLYVSLAGAVLTKGPAAIALFGGAFALFVLLRRENLRNLFTELRGGYGVVILAALVLPWFIAVGLATDWLWPKVFLLFENMDRFHGQTNHRNLNPLFYLWVLAYGLFPWTLALPAVLGKLRRQLLDNRLLCLLICWAVAVVGMFTLSSTKLQTYILPAFPAIAVLIGVGLDACIAAVDARRERAMPKSFALTSWCLAAVAMACIVVAGVLAASLVSGKQILPDPGFSTLTKIATVVVMLVCGAIGLAQFWLYKRNVRPLWIKSVVVANCLTVVLSVGLVFEIGYGYSQSDLHHTIEPLIGSDFQDSDIAIFAHFKPSLMFYLRHPVDSFFHPDALHPVNESTGKFTQYVLATDKQAPILMTMAGDKLQLVRQSGHWMLLRSDHLKLRKLPTLEDTFKSGISLSTGKYHWGTLPFAGVGNIQ